MSIQCRFGPIQLWMSLNSVSFGQMGIYLLDLMTFLIIEKNYSNKLTEKKICLNEIQKLTLIFLLILARDVF